MATDELILRGIAVPPHLSSHILGVWELEGRCATAAPQVLLPDGCVSLVLNLADPIEQLDAAGAVVARPGHMVIGEVRRPLSVQSAGQVHLLGVRFCPGAGQEFLEAPLAHLVDGVADASALRTSLLTAARQAASAHPRERAARVLAALQGQAPQGRFCSDLVRFAVQMLLQRHGGVAIDALAHASGVSRRQLERAFASEVGVTPKSLADVLRFRRAVTLAQQEGLRDWAGLAAACGYFDQSHLIRDFKRFAGCTPRLLAGERFSLTAQPTA